MSHLNTGYDSVFNNIWCENERHWRKSSGASTARFDPFDKPAFDECNNAWYMPLPPRTFSKLFIPIDHIGILKNLQRFDAGEESESKQNHDQQNDDNDDDE